LEFSASVGFIQKESVTMHGHNDRKKNKKYVGGILLLEVC